MGTANTLRLWVGATVVCSFCLGLPRFLFGYSVIAHEAIVDAEWETTIKPLLLNRFPNATAADLREARAYAYGGCVIQDLGYYPFGRRLFSHLTHYVRTGDFVQALFEESRDIDDYAFALGALSHYNADIEGHFFAVNRAVPLLYPELRRKHGDWITWEDSPWAHSLTEFGFDTLEVVDRHVAPQKYHDSIGFKVPKPVLERAFQRTYGLELKYRVLSVRILLFVYRQSAGKIVPEMSEVAWALRRKQLETTAKSLHHQHLYHLPNQTDTAWKKLYTKPGVGDKITAFVFRLVPKIGPLNVFQFNAPTAQTEKMFADSLKASIEAYEAEIKASQGSEIDPPNMDLDTGRLTEAGEYAYCDRTYTRLLDQLAHKHFAGVSPELRENLLNFYENLSAQAGPKHPRKSRKIARELEELKAAAPLNANPVATSTSTGAQFRDRPDQ